MTIETLGDASLLVILGDAPDDSTADRVRALAHAMNAHRIPGIRDIVPSYRTIGVHYDSLSQSQDRIIGWIENLNPADTPSATMSQEIVIPVCYGGPHGPDLADVAEIASLAQQEIIDLHCGASYTVRAVGFTPGFAYLAGLPEKVASPRKSTPRTRVPAGSVGIANNQTGVYPIESPGGWQLIGRTPLKLFRPDNTRPSLLQMGDRVRFQSISESQFKDIQDAP